jgi:hypothetical protein
MATGCKTGVWFQERIWNCLFTSSSKALRPVFGPWPPQPSSSTPPYTLLQTSSSESVAGWLHPSVLHITIYFVVSPLAFLLQNSFLVPSLGYDVVPFLHRGQTTLISLNVCMLKEPHPCTFYRSLHCTSRRSGFDPRQGQRIFPLTSVSRPALRPTQPPVQWVPGVVSPGQSAAGA